MDDLKLGGIDPVADKGLAVASGYFGGHQRTRPPYIGWNDAGVIQVRDWLKKHYPEFLAPRGKAQRDTVLKETPLAGLVPWLAGLLI